MSTYTPSITFNIGLRMDDSTTETTLTVPVVTLTQVKEPYQVVITDIVGSP